MILRVPQACLEKIGAEGTAAYPLEACGLLIGRDGEVTEVVAAVNISATPDRTFEVDPQTIIDWQKKLRGTDRRVIGCYHSHPDHPAQPSDRDRQRVYEDGQVWAILSVGGEGAGEMNFFRAEGGAFTPLEVSVF